MSCELRVASYELQVANYESRAERHELNVESQMQLNVRNATAQGEMIAA